MSVTRRAFAALAAATLAAPAIAQDKFPSKPIRLIVPFPPGASVDILARSIGQKLGSNLGVPIIVDNKPGASGIIAGEFVARQPPDGYSVLITVPSTHTIPIALGRKLPYDPIKDFTPLGILVNNPLAIVVNKDLPVKTLRELVEYARKHPGKLSYGTSGAGTSQHLVGEMLNQFAKIDTVHVPYKGGSGALNDLLAGQIQIGYVVVPTVIRQVKAGNMRMLAVIGDRRYSALPNVPTNREALPGFEPMSSWIGAYAPADLPPQIAKVLGDELRKATSDPEVAGHLEANGMPVVAGTAEQFVQRMRQDIEDWTPIVKAGRITAD